MANAKDGPLHKAEKYTFQTQPSAEQAPVNSRVVALRAQYKGPSKVCSAEKEHLGAFLCSLGGNVPLFVQLNRYSQLTALSDVFHSRGPTECAVLKMWKRCSNPNLIPLLYLCQRKQAL